MRQPDRVDHLFSPTRWLRHCISIVLPLPPFSKTVRYLAVLLRYHPRVVAPAKLGDAFCAAANAHHGGRNAASSTVRCLSLRSRCLSAPFTAILLQAGPPPGSATTPRRARTAALEAAEAQCMAAKGLPLSSNECVPGGEGW